MLVIDSNSGSKVKQGSIFTNINGIIRVLDIQEKPPHIFLQILQPALQKIMVLDSNGKYQERAEAPYYQKNQIVKIPLEVKNYLFWKIAYIPS